MTFNEALDFRHACKIFDENKKISDSDFNEILRAGIMAPSSMGMEHWEFEVISDKNLREKMRLACWNQPQITTCSHLVVIYAKISDLHPESDYVKKQIARRTDKTEAERENYKKMYASNVYGRYKNLDEVFGWSKSNCFLAAQNMMVCAAMKGIDSCPIEGFVREDLDAVLGVDERRKVALILPFGYRIKEAQTKFRRNLSEVVKYR